jgi:hypothetical protein
VYIYIQIISKATSHFEEVGGSMLYLHGVIAMAGVSY